MDTLNLSLLQPDLAWQDAAVNLKHLSTMLENVSPETNLIVLPEMFTSAFTMESGAIAENWPGPSLDWMLSIAETHQAAVCGSIAIIDAGKKFNRLVFVTPERKVHYYDKRHLFRMLGEHKRYSQGNDRIIIQWKGWRILPLVCYDLRFPVWCRNGADLNYDLILFVANWPAARRQHWRTLLEARAIENLAYAAGVNRIGTDGNGIDYEGDSLAVSPAGELLADAENQEGLLETSLSLSELRKYREAFPAHLDADSFIISKSQP